MNMLMTRRPLDPSTTSTPAALGRFLFLDGDGIFLCLVRCFFFVSRNTRSRVAGEEHLPGFNGPRRFFFSFSTECLRDDHSILRPFQSSFSVPPCFVGPYLYGTVAIGRNYQTENSARGKFESRLIDGEGRFGGFLQSPPDWWLAFHGPVMAASDGTIEFHSFLIGSCESPGRRFE